MNSHSLLDQEPGSPPGICFAFRPEHTATPVEPKPCSQRALPGALSALKSILAYFLCCEKDFLRSLCWVAKSWWSGAFPAVLTAKPRLPSQVETALVGRIQHPVGELPLRNDVGLPRTHHPLPGPPPGSGCSPGYMTLLSSAAGISRDCTQRTIW